MDDVDEVALFHGVQDLHEARVSQQRRGAGSSQHRAGAGMVGGEQMNAHRAAKLLVDGTPAAESVQTGDALFEPIALGELVAAVQIGRRRDGIRSLLPTVRALRARARCVLGLFRPVGRGLVRLGGQRLVAAVIGHVDGSRATFRHRRSCLPIRCAMPASTAQSRQLCPHSGAMHDTRCQAMVVRIGALFSARAVPGPCRPCR